MTLEELWRVFGANHADKELVFSLNGEEAVPVRGATYFQTDDGKTVIYMTNFEGAFNDLHKKI